MSFLPQVFRQVLLGHSATGEAGSCLGLWIWKRSCCPHNPHPMSPCMYQSRCPLSCDAPIVSRTWSDAICNKAGGGECWLPWTSLGGTLPILLVLRWSSFTLLPICSQKDLPNHKHCSQVFFFPLVYGPLILYSCLCKVTHIHAWVNVPSLSNELGFYLHTSLSLVSLYLWETRNLN